MVVCNCDNRFGCTGIAVAASLFIGVITAFLQLTAVITVTSVFLWVAFGIAVGYLAITVFAAAQGQFVGTCAETVLSALLIGVLGTALFSLILLAIDFAATGILAAVFTGILLCFFSLILTSTACLVKCLAADNR